MPSTYNLKAKRFILARSFGGWLKDGRRHGREKSVQPMAVKKQSEKGDGKDKNTSFQIIHPGTHLQPGPLPNSTCIYGMRSV